MGLIEGLRKRLGEHRVETLPNPLHGEQEIIRLYLELETPVTVISTCGLSDYNMPVSEKWKGREHTELFFCLPTYWDFEDTSNPLFNWVYDWIFKLEHFVRERQTWFGPGHTLPCGNPALSLSSKMKQDHFFLIDPIFLNQALEPLKTEGKTIYFLAIVPIFSDELDYKMGKGTHKLIRKLLARKSDERLDDYRVSVLRSRMRFF